MHRAARYSPDIHREQSPSVGAIVPMMRVTDDGEVEANMGAKFGWVSKHSRACVAGNSAFDAPMCCTIKFTESFCRTPCARDWSSNWSLARPPSCNPPCDDNSLANYPWKVCGVHRWRDPWERRREMAGRKLVLVGDSIAHQFFSSIVSTGATPENQDKAIVQLRPDPHTGNCLVGPRTKFHDCATCVM